MAPALWRRILAKFYVTTAIDYVNAAPHIGHALEKVQADAMARYHRLKGDDTLFLTGTDEHGSKLYRAAQAEGIDTQEFCDRMSEKFVELTKVLNLSNDRFVRTTQERHKRAAQKLWRACAHDIYSSVYRGLYCVGCEAYYLEKDLVDGKCPIHGTVPEAIEEQNYFFRLSAYQDALLAHYDAHPDFIYPEERFREIYSFVESGLEDISISRSKDKLVWGIEVPDDPNQVMYVWFDALTNYISAIGYADDETEFSRWWPASVHVIGKDISRFHAVLWPAMLMSAGLPLPEKIFIHGFLTVEGEKMSKSRGNVIDPVEIARTYGADPLRYYLIREIPTNEDGDFSQRRFEERFNFDLANDLGNLLHRSLNLLVKYRDGHLAKVADFGELENALIAEASRTVDAYCEAMDGLRLRDGAEIAMGFVRRLNKYIDEAAPWSAAKTEAARFDTIMYTLSEGMRITAVLIEPFMPKTARTMLERLGLPESELTLSAARQFGRGQSRSVNPGPPMFPRIEQ